MHSNITYSNLPPHNLPQYQLKCTTTASPPSHKDGGPTYCPLWPLPHDSSGCPALSYSVDSTPGHYWPTNDDQSGHWRGLINRPPTIYGRHNPQTYYHFDCRQPQFPPQYHILLLHCVSLPTSLTEDKNLL